MKTYAVCIDGTWNHPAQTDRDPRRHVDAVTETNVLRVFRFLTGVNNPLKPSDLSPIMQAPMRLGFKGNAADVGVQDVGTALYLSGIGTRGFWRRWFEGFTGSGTRERILRAYRFLAEHCRPDDRIFGFGFSRGAFAVRSLAGLIHRIGLPASPRSLSDTQLEDVSRAYWHSSGRTSAFAGHRPAEIHFLGLWDTVSALTFDRALGRADISPPNVRHVAHALALDEQRAIFHPEFWTASGNTCLAEAWFAGAHTNIGGGYNDEELSNIPLCWVVSKAAEADLPQSRNYIQGWHLENTFGFARNSYDEFLRSLRIVGRVMKGARQPRVILDSQGIHRSVFDRVEMATSSEYVTARTAAGQAVERYTPTAQFANGQGFPAVSDVFRGAIAETPDYLSGR